MPEKTTTAVIWGDERDSGGLNSASSVIVWNTREPLLGQSEHDFLERLKTALHGRVLEAWIFGSFGTQAFNRDSDVDLMLVVRTDKPFLDRVADFYDIMDLAASMDLLVYTPDEFTNLTQEPSPGFWTSVVKSMRRIV